MPVTVSELQVKVSADTSQAESGLASLGSKVGSVGSSIATAFGGVAIAGVAGLAAAFGGAVAAAANFEQSMSAIKAVSGATGAEMESLSGLALQLGADTSFSATEAASGIEELLKAGVSVGDVMGGGAAAALNLAAAGAVSVGEAATITSDAMNMFGLAGENATHVADLLAGASVASSTDVHGLGQGLAAVGAVAHTVGIGLDDTTTALALMAQAGVKGSDAGTSLKTMLLNLTPSTKAQMTVAKELGIVTADGANKFFDATGKAKGMSEVAQVLQDSMKGLTKQQQLAALQTLFGTDAIRAASIMAEAGAAGYDKMAAAEAKIGADEVAKTRLDNLKGSLQALSGSLETAGIELGTMLLPGLKSMVDGLTEWVNKGIGIIKMLPDAWADAKTAFMTGETGDAFGELLTQLGLSDATVTAAIGWTVKLGDAWRTMQQAFAGDWSPSDQIDPFVDSVGKAATALVSFNNTVVDAVAKAEAMGAWDDVATGFSNLNDIVGLTSDRLTDIGAALGRVQDPAHRAASASDVLAAAIKGGALGFQYATMRILDFIDTIGTSIAVTLDFVTAMSRTGDALNKLKSGDFPGAVTALGEAKTAFLAGTTAAEEFRQRGLLAVGDETKVMAQAVGMHFTATRSAVETNMSAANAAVADGSSGMQRFMEENGAGMVSAAETAGQGVATATETGMASAVGAVETQGPVAVAAMDTMGTGMAGAMNAAAPQITTAAETAATGVVTAVDAQTPAATAATDAMGAGMAASIGAAGPAMASAAEGAASAAVAAVQGQEGAASAAGQGVGDSLGSGMEGGILGWVSRIASAAASLVSSALGAARAEADSHSPSKKTQQLGEDMAEGLEIGLSKSNLGAEMQQKIRDFIAATRDYIPVAGEIARVEDEIKRTREQSQTDYLFRAQEMITIDSEALGLKADMVTKERDQIRGRQELAAASREVADIERGSLSDRTHLIEMDGQRKELRLQEIELEKQLIGLDPGSKKAASIQKSIDKLRDQSKELDLESEKTRLTGEVAATASKIKQESLADDARAQQTVIDKVKDQIEVLGGEQSVFSANENVIKNATQNEIDYRSRLIAVFTAEGKPLADRVTAGLKLVEQLHKEGKISDELYDSIKKVADAAGVGAEKTAALGSSADTAAPQMDAAARKAKEMADQAQRIADQAHDASHNVDALSSSLGRLPSWFHTGSSSSSSGSVLGFASGGRPAVNKMSLVGERGPELFAPDRPGTIIPADVTRAWMGAESGGGASGQMQTVRLDVAIGGKVAEQIYIEGRALAIRRGRVKSTASV